MRSKILTAAAALTISLISTSAAATPEATATAAGNGPGGGPTTISDLTHAANSSSGTYYYGCDAGTCSGQYANQSYADLRSGKLGSQSSGIGPNYASAQWKDEILFDFADGASGIINFSFLVDGTISPGPSSALFGFQIDAFSGLEPNGSPYGYLGTLGGTANMSNGSGVPFQPVFCVGLTGIPGCSTLSNFGEITSFTKDGITGSFTAQEGVVYRLQATLATYGDANFYNTGTFSFGQLGAGTTYRSTSGVFLSEAGAVPEPATWAMMLLGFGGIGFAMRKQRKPLLQIA